MELFIDFSRTLNKKERATIEGRRSRLDDQFGASVAGATKKVNRQLDLAGGLPAAGLRIRPPFAYLSEPIDEELVSDRRAPDREYRPSATRIASGPGIALRTYLTALALAQASTRPGKRPRLDFPIVAYSGEDGWSDFVATGAVRAGAGRDSADIRDKKGRSVRNALDTLEEAHLVHLPGAPRKRDRYKGFELQHEAGRQLEGDPIRYVVPREDEDCFALPAEFITQGWVHVLEDSEIALLLMVACGRGTLPAYGDNADLRVGEVAIPADVRLRHYGIHRDPFSAARKTLDWFGLLDVREVRRHDDGRGEDGEMKLHRLSLLPEGFGVDALSTVRGALKAQLARVE